ncbi:DUF2189 domain-containing protein [Pistricoccus aurantiacus]|uniref:DUF2189 domain-containing protein n=1 Tax=Pistricoccus aurantiacus TaxID=1883414 RepID=A0A5B8SU37_9GAMM|nr:DUF2189 domain-containing protein [Pistricoccus aurantiacus]QEA40672.1 DUF2189 domain-containing protein [Pistricoccus aurantiacus]
MMATTKSRSERSNIRITSNTIDMERPRAWLMAGVQDFRDAMGASLTYGAFWVVVSFLITLVVFSLDLWHFLLPLMAGFMLLGPLIAVGAYAISQKLERGETPKVSDAFGAWGRRTGQLVMMGLILALFFMAWFDLAIILFALFFGLMAPDPATLYLALLTTPQGWGMILVGTVLGGAVAFGAFSVSVVAIPTLMDQDLTFMEGIEASIRSVAHNFRPMLLWGAILTGCVIIGLVTFYIGLAFILPILGHASWHAYRDLVRIEPRVNAKESA